jgi:Arc/MetJ-type ribon-helix-helix transcriptional regulator
MDTMNIALPGPLKGYVRARVSEGGYGSVSEYVRELIRADRRRRSAWRTGPSRFSENTIAPHYDDKGDCSLKTRLP